MSFKDLLRSLLNTLHLDLTKNLEYDRLTKLILKRVIKNNSNCIDVGCHKGEILTSILSYSPNGKHFAFEPIPYLFNQLEIDFKNKATIFPYALSDKSGETTFQLVKNAPAYSGINGRKYAVANPDIEQINVQVRLLQEVIPSEIKIDFIKIDVEGGEFDVLKGAIDLLKRDKPFLIFECGMGASDYYGTKPAEIYSYLVDELGYTISTLKNFVRGGTTLSASDFEENYSSNKEYYFVAC